MAKKTTTEQEIVAVERRKIDYYIVGESPLICHAMSAKVQHELLLPAEKSRKKADRALRLKHDPAHEYRNSVHLAPDDAPTHIAGLPTWFKNCIKSAALDVPGATKAQIGRLVYVEGTTIPIYGVPYMHMAIVRCADMNKTPDVRTRAILPEWCCKLTVEFASPLIKEGDITRLFGAGGIMGGVGDWRPQKGNGDYGRFRLVPPGDKDWKRIAKQGRAAQEAALVTPTPFDAEARKLFEWFNGEIESRELSALLKIEAA